MQNWYIKCKKHAQSSQAQVHPTPTAVTPEQTLQTTEQSGNSFMVKLKDRAVKKLLDSELVVRYLMKPTDENREILVQTVLDSAIRELSGEIPGFGRLIGSLPITAILSKFPWVKDAYGVVGKFVLDNLRIGFIPDNISSQSDILKKWDMDDNLAAIFSNKVKQLASQDPILAQNFIIIIMRLKNDKNLLDAQRRIVGV